MAIRLLVLKIFIVVNVAIVSIQAQEQNALDKAHYKFYYEYTWQFDTLNNNAREDLIILQVGQNISKSYSYYTFRSDSLKATPDGDNVSRESLRNAFNEARARGEIPRSLPFGRRMSTKVYKNYPQGKMTITDNINEDYYKYYDELHAQSWQIIDSTKNVLDYPCQMAVTDFRGRSWIAWFASDIPIGDGPWKFSGLPGLIMKVYDTENHYHFTLVGINQVENDPIVFSPVVLSFETFGKYEKTSRIEFLKGLNWYRNNRAVVLNTQLGIKLFDESLQDPGQYDFIERDYK